MCENGGVKGEPHPPERAIEEARRTIDFQYRTLADVDTKASRLLRLNLLVVGLLLTGLSISAGRSPSPPQAILNEYTAIGLVLLLVSTVLAGITYTATRLRIGVDASTVRQMVSGELSEEQVDRGLAKSYARWIEKNARASRTNARLVSITIAVGTYAIVFLATGSFVMSSGYPSQRVHSVLIAVGLLIVGGMGWQRVGRWVR